MDRSLSQPSLYRYFTGLAEYTFETRLGVCDPPLVDYVSALLARFVHSDAIFNVRNLVGKRLEQVAEMAAEAEARIGLPKRDVHRHIGDFTLFWTGVYPEALNRLRGEHRQDHLIDYREQGKRAYWIASTIRTGENVEECKVLERLSHEFELCAYGLREVRREWERREPNSSEGQKPFLLD